MDGSSRLSVPQNVGIEACLGIVRLVARLGTQTRRLKGGHATLLYALVGWYTVNARLLAVRHARVRK